VTTVTLVQLVAPQALPTTDSALYTAPTQTTAQIGRAVFTNTSGSAVTLTAGISLGGALAAATTMISARSLAPGEAYVSPELAAQVLPAGSAFRAYASASGVSVTVSGITIT